MLSSSRHFLILSERWTILAVEIVASGTGTCLCRSNILGQPLVILENIYGKNRGLNVLHFCRDSSRDSSQTSLRVGREMNHELAKKYK